MSESADIELLHRAWKAMSVEGDLSVLEGALDPEAKWLGVEDGQICENRKMILTIMERNLHGGLVGRIEETVEVGGRIVVAFRPDQPRNDERPLDQGIAYVVVTMRDGRVIELKGCADRAAAMTYAQTGPGAGLGAERVTRPLVRERSTEQPSERADRTGGEQGQHDASTQH